MCHESTSVGLPKTIGSPVGTVWLDDFDQTDCIFDAFAAAVRACDWDAIERESGLAREALAAAVATYAGANAVIDFIAPSLVTDPETPSDGADVLRLMTVRSDDQFNTTIYSLDDRFRGVEGTRKVLLMHADDDGERREVGGPTRS
jgi:anaerobic selenocysteine-containing dehydrogenase